MKNYIMKTASLLLACAPLTVAANSLQDVYDKALQNNAEYQAATAIYKSGLEQRKISRAALLPQLSLSGGLSDSETTLSGDSLGDSESEVSQYSASLTQTLFDLSAWNRYKQGAALSLASTSNYAFAQQELILRSAQAYFNVLRAEENLRSGEAEEKAIGQQLKQTKERFQVGLVAITDVNESQAGYDSAVAQRLGFEADLGVAFEALANLTGESWGAIAPLKPEFKATRPQPADSAEWLREARINSPVLATAQHANEAAKRNASAAKFDHLPTVTGSIDYQNSDFDNLESGISTIYDNETTTYAINLSMPIYMGGGVSAQRRKAAFDAQQAAAELLSAERNLTQEVRTLHLLVNTNVAKVKAGNQGVVSSESALRAIQEGYKAGTRNTVDLLIAQQNLYRAKRDAATFLYDYIISLLGLKRVTGVLMTTDLDALDIMLTEQKSVTPL